MTAPDLDSEEAREIRFLDFYDLKPNPTEADLEASLSAWRRMDMSASFLEALNERLKRSRRQRNAAMPEHRQTIVSAMLASTPSAGRTGRACKYSAHTPHYRRECSCGFRGVWLRNPSKVASCPRAQGVR